MALVVMVGKAYGDEPETDYPNLAAKAKFRNIANASSVNSI